jgi:hypothetical protein
MQAIADRTVRLIDSLEPTGNLNAELERLVESELLRRLVRYELVDKQLFRKYGMSFDDFRQNRIVEKANLRFKPERTECLN